MKNKHSIGIDMAQISQFDPSDELFVKKMVRNELIFFDLLDSSEKKQKFLAKVWVLKEAIYKANNKINIYDIEIGNLDSGQPICFNYPEISLSLTYCKDTIIAIALWVPGK